MRKISEIKKKIEELKKERKKLPQYSMFGTPNWLLLDTNIRILEDVIKNKRDEILLEEKWDSLVEEYGGNFPDDDTEDYARMNTYDWLLEKTDEL